MKAETIYHEQTSNTRNVKGNPSSRSKIIPYRNLDLSKETKTTRNGNSMGKCIRFFII